MMGYGGYNVQSSNTQSPQKGGFGANTFNTPTDSPKLRQNQSLRPVSINQLQNATSSYADAPLQVDGSELSQVCVVGRVLSVNVSASNVMYVVDDTSGTIEVRHYTDNSEDNQSEPTFE